MTTVKLAREYRDWVLTDASGTDVYVGKIDSMRLSEAVDRVCCICDVCEYDIELVSYPDQKKSQLIADNEGWYLRTYEALSNYEEDEFIGDESMTQAEALAEACEHPRCNVDDLDVIIDTDREIPE